MDLSGLFNRDPHINPYHEALQTGLENYQNSVKAAYLPMTTQANALSKLAYAQLMGPQFLAKLFNNPDFLANLDENTLKGLAPYLAQAAGIKGAKPKEGGDQTDLGEGQGQTQPAEQNQGSSWWDNFKNNWKQHFDSHVQPDTITDQSQQQNNQVVQPNNVQEQPLVDVNKITDTDPNSELGKATNAWRSSPMAKIQAEKDGYFSTPPAEQLLPWYRSQQGKTETQQPAAQQQAQSTPIIPNLSIQATKPKTFAENVSNFKGLVKEGEEAGTLRAKDIKDLNDVVMKSTTDLSTLKELGQILSNPEIEKLRQNPLMGHYEMAYYAKEGTPAQQQLVGRYQTLTNAIIKDSSRDFAGQFRAGEQQLLETMKPNDSDTIDVARGKAEALTYMTRMLYERARLTSAYMENYHISKGKALEAAEKQLDVSEIKRQIHDSLNPKIRIKNKVTGEVLTLPAAEARKLMGV